MDNKQNTILLVMAFLRRFGVVFSAAILAIASAGMINIRYTGNANDISTLFVTGGGLSYGAVFQIAGFAAIMAVVIMLLFSDYLSARVGFLWRLFFLFLATVLTASLFVIIFKWFPADDTSAWLLFGLSTTVCFAASAVLLLLKIKLEGKKYGKLLAQYRSRRGV